MPVVLACYANEKSQKAFLTFSVIDTDLILFGSWDIRRAQMVQAVSTSWASSIQRVHLLHEWGMHASQYGRHLFEALNMCVLHGNLALLLVSENQSQHVGLIKIVLRLTWNWSETQFGTFDVVCWDVVMCLHYGSIRVYAIGLWNVNQ